MVADFQSQYGIRLAVADLDWREFFTLLIGLLGSETRIQRFVASQPVKEEQPDER